MIPALQTNLKVNDLNHVQVVQRGAGVEPSRATMYRPSHNNLGTASLFDRASNEGETTDIAIEPVDGRWDAMGRPPIGAVKMDIQGAEFAALQGMVHLLEACKPTIIMEYSPRIARQQDWLLRDVVTLLETHGYTGGRILKNDSGPLSIDQLAHPHCEPRSSVDIVFA